MTKRLKVNSPYDGHLIDEIDKGEKVVIIDKGKILEKGDVDSVVKKNKVKNIREAFNKLVKI